MPHLHTALPGADTGFNPSYASSLMPRINYFKGILSALAAMYPSSVGSSRDGERESDWYSRHGRRSFRKSLDTFVLGHRDNRFCFVFRCESLAKQISQSIVVLAPCWNDIVASSRYHSVCRISFPAS